MMLPKYYYLKALGGSSANSSREMLSSLTRSYLKHSAAREQTPPKRRYRRSRDLTQSPRGLKRKLPPRDAIVAHASSNGVIIQANHSPKNTQRFEHKPSAKISIC